MKNKFEAAQVINSGNPALIKRVAEHLGDFTAKGGTGPKK
jgi:hypothetical protein